MARFRSGDIVELNSGSVPMTVNEYYTLKEEEPHVVCVWCDATGINRLSFREEALMLKRSPEFDWDLFKAQAQSKKGEDKNEK